MSRRAIARPAIRRARLRRLARLERLALVPDRGDLVPVGEALAVGSAGLVIGSREPRTSG